MQFLVSYLAGPAFIQINMRQQIQGLAILLKDAYR